VAGPCQHCDGGDLAVWRCKDCALPTPMCRHCTRSYHGSNPFHHIECWTSCYFRPANLWEVDSYILIWHYSREPLCDSLKCQIESLETTEVLKDKAKQNRLMAPAPWEAQRTSLFDKDMDMQDLTSEAHGTRVRSEEEDMDDDQFMQYLENLKNQVDIGHAKEDPEMEDELDAEEDIPSVFDTHAASQIAAGHRPTAGASSSVLPVPSLRMVHTNGIHDIPLVSCECRGEDNLPFNLMSARLLPTSFKRIKTLFTAQLLDFFRLSNLELKASAYQFYQLLRRLTLLAAPAEVADLYREFRRMSRIWRWMKRLKWAGYGFPKRKVAEVKKGELANFCPACPQPGINIPDNWRDNTARHVDPPRFIPYSFNYLDGFIKGYSWLMEISRLIMFNIRNLLMMCGCPLEVE